jgi:hypothetical protein
VELDIYDYFASSTYIATYSVIQTKYVLENEWIANRNRNRNRNRNKEFFLECLLVSISMKASK